MSSSRRSSSTSASLGRCPTCGGDRVVRVEEDVDLTIRGRVHHFPRVLHEHCTDCGERIFDLDTSHRFDSAIGSRTKKHAA